ncbi:UNVERIFIED_CONTAM: hypothetical protein FKN15_077921 [Acipenser sinensis]
MEKGRRRRNLDPSPPTRETKVKVKQEKLSPARPQKPRRSSSGSDRSGGSPPLRRRRGSRSPAKRRERSPRRRESRSPRNRRSKSPRNADTNIKREHEDHHRGHDEKRHRDRYDVPDDRRTREEPRERHRDRGGEHGDRQNRAGARGRDRDAQNFQQQQTEREQHDERRRENRRRVDVSNSDVENQEFGEGGTEDKNHVAKENPNFELSGALVEDTNTFRGVVIKYNEPPEARIPKRRWRLYPFKNDEPLPVMYVHRQSAYLMGRQRKIADIPIDHPSCSKQHAVFQYRRRDRDAQNFQQQQTEREQHDERRRENRRRVDVSNSDVENQEFDGGTEDKNQVAKENPNFELSGALVEDTNTFRGVVIKYNEPPEARIPKRRWRLYPFKNDEPLPVMYVHRQSAYLMGRQRKIADIPIDHPSCSKQHAVFQYRLVEFTRSDGTAGRKVKPYIIDLGSGNGTYLNNQRIEAQRYYELKEKDVLKFGFSSREYVLLHESSDTAEVDAKKDDDDEEDDEGLDK